jgi:hypothetical protein
MPDMPDDRKQVPGRSDLSKQLPLLQQLVEEEGRAMRAIAAAEHTTRPKNWPATRWLATKRSRLRVAEGLEPKNSIVSW